MSNNYDSLRQLQNGGYSWKVAFTYIFNLIFGAGALALPKAFTETGIVLGLVTLLVLVLMSYCACTFIIETMAIMNAILRYNSLTKNNRCAANIEKGLDSSTEEADEHMPLMNGSALKYTDVKCNNNENINCNGGYGKIVAPNKDKDPIQDLLDNDELFEITTKVEVGEMATMFFNKVGVIFFYSIVSLYLYGAIAIYASGISKCLTTVICGDTDIFQGDVHLTCPRVPHLSIIGIYHCMLAVVTVVLGPFVFFNMSKAKFLQVFTTLFRWLSFAAMLTLSIIKIFENKVVFENKVIPLKLFNFNGLSSFFGIGLASLMCQNALPSILTNIKQKKKLKLVVMLDFITVFFFLVFLVLTAAFAFGEGKIQDVYTLNFSHPTVLKYALQLFPVFTLSANFPTVGITLCENLKTLFLRNKDEEKYGFVVRRLVFPLITVIPPVIISYYTYDVGMLVCITGVYPGALLQYLFPALFVFFGRRYVKKLFGASRMNKYQSGFAHTFWVIVMLVAYALSLVCVTVNFIL